METVGNLVSSKPIDKKVDQISIIAMEFVALLQQWRHNEKLFQKEDFQALIKQRWIGLRESADLFIEEQLIINPQSQRTNASKNLSMSSFNANRSMKIEEILSDEEEKLTLASLFEDEDAQQEVRKALDFQSCFTTLLEYFETHVNNQMKPWRRYCYQISEAQILITQNHVVKKRSLQEEILNSHLSQMQQCLLHSQQTVTQIRDQLIYLESTIVKESKGFLQLKESTIQCQSFSQQMGESAIKPQVQEEEKKESQQYKDQLQIDEQI